MGMVQKRILVSTITSSFIIQVSSITGFIRRVHVKGLNYSFQLDDRIVSNKAAIKPTFDCKTVQDPSSIAIRAVNKSFLIKQYIHANTSGSKLIATPNASRTSALPQADELDRFPCCDGVMQL